jgi:hypothetical protein
LDHDGYLLLLTASASKLRASRVVFDHYNYQKVKHADTVSYTPYLLLLQEAGPICV